MDPSAPQEYADEKQPGGYPPQQPQAPQQQQGAYPTQQQQGAYPPQQQQGAYPPQPMTAYPQPGYQPGYQPAYADQAYPQGPMLTAEAPPPYYPGQQSMQQQSTNNTVVVTTQPAPQVHTVYRTGNSEYALPAIIFAVAVTVCFLSLGCWYAIICSGIGIALAAAASSSASAGDMETAKQYNTGSIVFTVVSLVSAVLPFIALIIWIIALSG